MNAIYKFVMSVLAKRGGKTGLTTIQSGKGFNVELSVKQIEQTLTNMGVDISKITSPKEVEKYLNIQQSWLKKQATKKSKPSADVLDLAGKKIDTSKGIMGGFEIGTKTKTSSPFKKVDLSKYDDAALNALAEEGNRIKVQLDKLGKSGTNYEQFTKLSARKREIDEILTAAQDVPASGYDNFKADIAAEKQIKTKLEGMNKKTVDRIRRRRYEAALKAEREKMAKDSDYIPEILDPDDFAYGGLAGMLGEREPYQWGGPGGKSPGTRADYTPGQGHRENIGRPPGGGDPGMTYTAPSETAVAKRKKYIESILPSGPSDRHPGTGKMPVFPRKSGSPFRNMFIPEFQKRRYLYQDEEDIPEGILELLKKDPNFDLETFKNIGWSMPENVWDKGAQGLRGIYYGDLPERIKVPMPSTGEPPGERKRNLMGEWIPGEKEWNPEDIEGYTETTYRTPSGGPTERVWEPEKLGDPTSQTFTPGFFGTDVEKQIDLQMRPFKEDDTPMIRNPNEPTSYTDESRMSNADKARVALHEMRHKKYIENPELWKSQPQWVQEVEMPGTTENIQFRENRVRAPVGHELYNRFLDQRYFPPMRNPGGEPYFDKILKDLWEPSAKKYEKIINEYDLSPVNLAGGGLAGMLGEPTYADGGRTGFKKGTKFDPKRRTILKGIATLATLPIIGKYFKWAKPLAKTSKVLTQVPIGSAEGMPAWFKLAVNRVIKEGDDVTKKFATKDREIVHRAQIDKNTTVDVVQDLETGNVRLEYDAADNLGYGPIQLDYKAGEIIEQGSKRGTKTKPEFSAVESEPRVTNWDGDIEFDGENIVSKVDDLLTDTTKLETYATGKNPTIKKLLKSEQKKKYVNKLNDDVMEQHDYIEKKTGHTAPESLLDEPMPDDMASGGRVPLGGGKLVLEGLMALGKGVAKGEGKFTKSEVLLQMFENTVKQTKSANTKKRFSNFIKEIKGKPELANDPEVWNFFIKGLPKNQKLVVYGDDTVDFWKQSEFGPHNIETTTKFHEKHPYLTRDQAVKIQNMEPEDQIFEMKRLETIRKRTTNATGGRVPMIFGGGIYKTIITNLAKLRGVNPSEYLRITNYKALPKEVRNLMSKADFEKMKAGRIEMFANWLEMAKSRQKFQQSIAKGKETPAAPLFEDLEKSFKSPVPHGVTDEQILQGEQILKNLKTKGRKPNATGGRVSLSAGGLAGMLGE